MGDAEAADPGGVSEPKKAACEWSAHLLGKYRHSCFLKVLVDRKNDKSRLFSMA
ncbi:hypothetical protein [Martelella alba]|uniref:hypothetical protein n=1 Tax=Martelella alba TaxID=2590451 RepID=UPI0015E8320A|nr:hypothetical protein [Martelella alba]